MDNLQWLSKYKDIVRYNKIKQGLIMFISKLVCDKCGTEVSTGDKFCRECGTQGRSLGSTQGGSTSTSDFQDMLDKLKKPVTSTPRCKTCGKTISDYGHDCPGLFPVDKGIDIRWATNK